MLKPQDFFILTALIILLCSLCSFVQLTYSFDDFICLDLFNRYFYSTQGSVGFMSWKWPTDSPAELNHIISALERPFLLNDLCSHVFWLLCVHTHFYMVQFICKILIPHWFSCEEGDKFRLWTAMRSIFLFLFVQFHISGLVKKLCMCDFQDSLAIWGWYLVRLHHCSLREWKPDTTLI